MRSLPINRTSRGGGRPRQTRSAWNAFGAWLLVCGLRVDAIAKELGISESAIYNARNGYYKPGWPLRFKIAALSKNAVPPESWDDVKARTRKRRGAWSSEGKAKEVAAKARRAKAS